MKSLYEALSKSMIKQLKKHHCYLIVPVDTYTYFFSNYDKNYIKMRKDKYDNYPSYGCWVLSQEEIEKYKEKFPNRRNDLIYEILSKETDPLKLINYFNNNSSIYFQDTKFFKKITI